jgi:hypothetical protein
LYGPNVKVGKNGENAANYSNPEFDRLFDRMKNMENGPERQAIIDEMQAIARHDAPWLWGYFPKQFALRHAWYLNAKTNLMANNTLKYRRIEPQLRARLQAEWNKPVRWPLGLVAALLLLVLVPAWIGYQRRQRMPAHREAH